MWPPPVSGGLGFTCHSQSLRERHPCCLPLGDLHSREGGPRPPTLKTQAWGRTLRQRQRHACVTSRHICSDGSSGPSRHLAGPCCPQPARRPGSGPPEQQAHQHGGQSWAQGGGPEEAPNPAPLWSRGPEGRAAPFPRVQRGSPGRRPLSRAEPPLPTARMRSRALASSSSGSLPRTAIRPGGGRGMTGAAPGPGGPRGEEGACRGWRGLPLLPRLWVGKETPCTRDSRIYGFLSTLGKG